MSFRDFYMGLSQPEREAFASRAGTTPGYCNKIIYGGARVELGFADVMVAVSGGVLSHKDIPMTDRAVEQMQIRSQGATA